MANTYWSQNDWGMIKLLLLLLYTRHEINIMADKAESAVYSEMNQLHMRDTFEPKHWKELTHTQRQTVLESHMFLKEKREKRKQLEQGPGGPERPGVTGQEGPETEQIIDIKSLMNDAKVLKADRDTIKFIQSNQWETVECIYHKNIEEK